MRLLFAALLLGGLTGGALAQSRPNTTSMSCEAAATMISKGGAVITATGPATFDRFVASRAFCTVSETLEPAFVHTRDNSQCFIGYRCREVPIENRR